MLFYFLTDTLGHFLNLLAERFDLLVRDAFHFRKCVFFDCVEVDAVIVEGLGECDIGEGGSGFGGGFCGGGEDGFEVCVDVGGEEGIGRAIASGTRRGG
jgi:hypothetical protein